MACASCALPCCKVELKSDVSGSQKPRALLPRPVIGQQSFSGFLDGCHRGAARILCTEEEMSKARLLVRSHLVPDGGSSVLTFDQNELCSRSARSSLCDQESQTH